MNKAMYLLIIVSLIIFVYFALQGDRFLDGDSYYYLRHSRDGAQPQDNDLLFKYLVPLFHANTTAIKLFFGLIFISCLLVIAKIGELFDKEYGYLLAFILYAFTFFITEFFKFENDTIGYLFGFVGIYFVLLFWKRKQIKFFVLSILFFVLGALFWEGVFYWALTSIVFSLWYLPFVALIPIIGLEKVFGFFQTNPNIMEGQFGTAIIYFGLTAFCWFGAIRTELKLIIITIILTIPAIFYSKFYILPLLFLCIITFNGLKYAVKNKEAIATVIIVLSLFMVFFWITNLDKGIPSANDLALIKMASPDVNQNSFGIGWIIQYYGGNPSSKSGYGGGINHDYNLTGNVLLETLDFNACPIIKQTEHLVYAKCSP